MKTENLKNTTIGLMLIISLFSYFGCNGQVEKSETKATVTEVEKVSESDFQEEDAAYNQYQNEKKHGIWRTRYGNGKLKSEVNYVEGKKEGVSREWWENGNLWTDGIYKNDTANGLMKWHNQEGILVAEGNMKNSKRDGKWRICDLSLISNCIEASFKDGKKIGLWEILHDNGKVKKEQNYEDGKMISEKCWDEKGKKVKCD